MEKKQQEINEENNMDGMMENKDCGANANSNTESTNAFANKLYALTSERDRLDSLISKYCTASLDVTNVKNAIAIMEREKKDDSPMCEFAGVKFRGEYEIDIMLNAFKDILLHKEELLKEVEQSLIL